MVDISDDPWELLSTRVLSKRNRDGLRAGGIRPQQLRRRLHDEAGTVAEAGKFADGCSCARRGADRFSSRARSGYGMSFVLSVMLAAGTAENELLFVSHDNGAFSARNPFSAEVEVAGAEAWLYVFDRVTGEPIWPIEEKPVPKGDVPGEWYAPTQPHPPAALMYGRNALNEEDLIDFTPELRAQAKKQLERYKWRPGVVYNPPIVGNVNGLLGAINMGNANGGTNWPGGGYDPETRTVFAQASMASIAAESVSPPPPGFSDLPYQAGVVGQPFRLREAAGTGTYADVPQRGAAAGGRGPAAERRAGRDGAGRGTGARRRPRRRHAGRTRRRRRRPHRSGALDREAAVRRAGRDRSRQGRDQVARAARRNAGRGPQPRAVEGHDDPEDRPGRQRRPRDHEDARHPRRSAVHDDAAASARRDAARLRQGDGQGSRRRLHSRAAERLADDLHGSTAGSTSWSRSAADRIRASTSRSACRARDESDFRLRRKPASFCSTTS